MRLWNLYYYLFQFSPLIPLYFAFRHATKLDRPRLFFRGYLLTSIILTIIMTYLAKHGHNTVWLMNLSLPLYAFWLLSMFSLWEKNVTIRRAMWFAIPVFAAVWGLEIVLTGVMFEFTTYARPLLGALFIAASCRALYQGNKDTERTLLDQPQFWISAGILLYYGGMIAINLASESLLRNSQDGLFAAFMIQPALNLIAHLMYVGGYRT